jgi:hypothetical protein
MKYGFMCVGMLVVGILTFVFIFVAADATIVDQEEYYSLKEAMEGAMYDAIDIDYYQKTGELKIIEEKFVESFARRFTEVSGFEDEGYNIEYYDIIESPPKASVRIIGKTQEYNLTIDSDDYSSYNIINQLDSILTYNADHLYTYERYIVRPNTGNENTGESTGKKNSIGGTYKQSTYMNSASGYDKYRIYPEEFKTPTELEDKTCNIVNIEYDSAITTIEDLLTYTDNCDSWYTSNSDLPEYQADQITLYSRCITTKSGISGITKNTPADDVIDFIETVDYFNTVKNNNKVTYLQSIGITLKQKPSANHFQGIKVRVTWQCTS